MKSGWVNWNLELSDLELSEANLVTLWRKKNGTNGKKSSSPKIRIKRVWVNEFQMYVCVPHVYDLSALVGCWSWVSIRHGPFDILGGGWDILGKKIPCSDFGLKNNLAQWYSEKNNLSPIVQPELTYRLVWDVKIQNFLLARFARQKIINNFKLYLLPARHVKIYFQTDSSFVWSLISYIYFISLFHNKNYQLSWLNSSL